MMIVIKKYSRNVVFLLSQVCGLYAAVHYPFTGRKWSNSALHNVIAHTTFDLYETVPVDDGRKFEVRDLITEETVNKPDKFGRTPLWETVSKVQKEYPWQRHGVSAVDINMVTSLLCRGADVNQKSPSGWSTRNKKQLYKFFPLYVAIKNDNAEVMRILIAWGAQTERVNRFCDDVVEMSIEYRSLTCLKELQQLGYFPVNIKAKNYLLDCAIGSTGSKPNYAMMQYIMEDGAEVTDADHNGQTILARQDMSYRGRATQSFLLIGMAHATLKSVSKQNRLGSALDMYSELAV